MEMAISTALLVNIVFTAGVVFMIDMIYEKYLWNYSTSLTSLNFLASYLMCEALIYFGLLNRKRLPWKEAIPIGVAWSGAIVFANFSLLTSSSGWYHATKLAVAPVLVLWQIALFRVRSDKRELWALGITILGLSLLVITDFTPNLRSSTSSFFHLLSIASAQTWIQTRSQKHNISPMQLLHNITSWCFILLAPFAAVVDFWLVGSWVHWNTKGWSLCLWLFFASLLSIPVNMSCVTIIVLKGPLMFWVFWCSKILLIFIIGELLLGNSWEVKKIVGVILALGGICAYVYLKRGLELQSPKGYLKVEFTNLERDFGDLDGSKLPHSLSESEDSVRLAATGKSC